MRNFIRRRRQNYVPPVVLQQISRQLHERYSSNQCGGTSYQFIHPSHARDVITRDVIRELFISFDWYHEDDRTSLWQQMSLIICILISFDYSPWENFKPTFFPDGQRFENPLVTDEDLPLKDISILPQTIQRQFRFNQYIFTPIQIHEGDPRVFEENERLPFLSDEPIRDDEQGAQGLVSKVTVQIGYVHYDNPRTTNDRPTVMACKRIRADNRVGHQGYLAEQRTMRELRQSLHRNERIMQSFASFIHGNTFVILSKWAAGRDLQKFLNVPSEIMEDFPQRSNRFTPHNLLIECRNLADALKFLHHGLSTESNQSFQCAHHDLKPENVLVDFPENREPSERPVGQWMITDFGMSNVEEIVVQNTRVNVAPSMTLQTSVAPANYIRSLSIRPTERHSGAYLPPPDVNGQQSKVSTARDVWSLGCIFAMVLAFAVGGPDAVRELHTCRSHGTDDKFYQRAAGTGYQIKPPVREWLEVTALSKLTGRVDWFQHSVSLCFSTLNLDIVQRPNMQTVVAEMNQILTWTAGQCQTRIWEFDQDPEVVTTVPEAPINTGYAQDPEPVGPLAPAISLTLTPPRGQSGTRTSRSPTTLLSQIDPSFSFLLIRIPSEANHIKTALSPSAKVAVTWNVNNVFVHDLSSISDESSEWEGRPSTVAISSNETRRITSPPDWNWSKVCINDRYLALIEEQGVRQRLRIYKLDISQRQTNGGSRTDFAITSCGQPIELEQRAHQIKLSCKGSCLLKFTNMVRYCSEMGNATVTQGEQDVIDFEFSTDGEYFCLWEQDVNDHYWTVYDTQLNVIGGRTICHSRRLGQDERAMYTSTACLIPFHRYARFIAVDGHSNVFLVRADLPARRAEKLGPSGKVMAGLMYPDDCGFILLKNFQDQRQRIYKFSLTSLNGIVSFVASEGGPLYQDLDKKSDSIAIRNHTGESGRLCLVSLSRSGNLTRKML